MPVLTDWIPRLRDALRPGARAGSGAAPRTPEGLRLYAIGDVHGRKDLLDRLHDRIRADIARHPDRTPVVIHLGDYVDRGPDSRGVVETLCGDPFPGVETLALRGNHEDAMLAFLNDPIGASAWLGFGGVQTLTSYGVAVPADPGPEALAAMSRALGAALPDTHRAFLRSLLDYAERGDYLFVHAGIRPGVPLERQDRADLMYIREPFLSHRRPLGHMVVHGHHVGDGPVVKSNRIGIDTGAFATGCLTGLVLDGAERAFLTT
ncbi:metallophosphoesterase family protein [Roseospira navarrensis]|uniref:Serine/threonine protein phosphatase n=1 Tax=Roseospira navarrensis TaxID=140058 RepID=A0A7X2D3V0_9PROT|nr:metallophosphoesterase family protein [Roseospira navarrensis]MQX35560.1 serine/threonine protein phosphatase [Roseospira navarrensis]